MGITEGQLLPTFSCGPLLKALGLAQWLLCRLRQLRHLSASWPPVAAAQPVCCAPTRGALDALWKAISTYNMS